MAVIFVDAPVATSAIVSRAWFSCSLWGLVHEVRCSELAAVSPNTHKKKQSGTTCIESIGYNNVLSVLKYYYV